MSWLWTHNRWYVCSNYNYIKAAKLTRVRSRHWVHEASCTFLIHPGCFHFEWFAGATCQVVSIASVAICHAYVVAKLFDAVCGSICVGCQILRKSLEVRKTCWNWVYFYCGTSVPKPSETKLAATTLHSTKQWQSTTDMALLQYFTEIGNTPLVIKLLKQWIYSQSAINVKSCLHQETETKMWSIFISMVFQTSFLIICQFDDKYRRNEIVTLLNLTLFTYNFYTWLIAMFCLFVNALYESNITLKFLCIFKCHWQVNTIVLNKHPSSFFFSFFLSWNWLPPQALSTDTHHPSKPLQKAVSGGLGTPHPPTPIYLVASDTSVIYTMGLSLLSSPDVTHCGVFPYLQRSPIPL